MSYRRQILTLFLVMAAFLAPLNAIPGHDLDLDKLTSDSTFIVLGDLSIQEGIGSSVVPQPNAPGMNARVDQGTIAIDRVLKGDGATTSLTFRFLVPDQFIGWVPPYGHGYGLFFLKQTDAGTLELTDPYHSWLFAVRGINVTGATLSDRVVSILQALTSVPDSTVDQRNMALQWLILIRTDAATQAFRSALSNPDPVFRLNVAGVLMWSRGDASGMAIMKQAYLPGPQPSLPGDLTDTTPNAVMALRDPNLMSDFEALLGSSSTAMRRAAAAAISYTGTPAAITGLKVAMGDSDVQVRYYGVRGLAALANQLDWLPTIDEYKADESKYLNHWREWARNH